MVGSLTRLLQMFTMIGVLAGIALSTSVALGQQKKLGTAPYDYPVFFKVYSKDGQESLTAKCLPTDFGPVVDQVTCQFVNVRFIPPEERINKLELPLSLEEALRSDPKLKQEWQKAPQKVKREWQKTLETVKQEICSPSSEGRKTLEAEIGAPESGPKKKHYLQQILAACSNENPTLLLQRLVAFDRRKCDLWVDHFSLEFKRIKEGQWIYQQERPGLLSKVLKVYELTRDDLSWTLTETRVSTEEAEEKPTQKVWSWKYPREYELPCDFISHDLVQSP